MSAVPPCLLSSLTVVQPPHLEGDPSLATEILPGPPSLDSVQQQLSKKTEHRKLALPSYLPLSDPGTTYTSLAGGMAAMALDDNGPRRKRARMDKGSVSSRSQRASARHLTGGVALSDPGMILEADVAASQAGVDDNTAFNEEDRSTSHSRSVSAPFNGEPQGHSVSANGTRITNGKGKGKDRENPDRVAQVRVKEEPVALQLSDIPAAPVNEDHCSSCSSVGSLVYCDGCPRAFHLWCLDPPMDPSDFPEGEESWFCPACKASKGPPPKPSHTFLSPLIQQLQSTIPTEFRLPEEIRTFFRDVGTGPGGVYVDNSSVKASRIGRHGFGEERDPYRLKDNKGAPVICFRCGKSALPDESSAGISITRTRRASTVLSQSKHWRGMISCDFCPLHWHIDCLDPPLTSLPPINRKWKCPNHASESAPKTRTPRSAAAPIDITGARQRNNGNIEVISSESPLRSEEKMSVDEVLINGRRYRVPERIIVLDFWNKVRQQKTTGMSQSVSGASSPLTSLSSLDDPSDQHHSALTLNDRPLRDDDTLRVAELLCQLHSRGSIYGPNSNEREQRKRLATFWDRRRPVEHNGTKSTGLAQVENRLFHRPASRSSSMTLSLDQVATSKHGLYGIGLSRRDPAMPHRETVSRGMRSASVSTRSVRNSTRLGRHTVEANGKRGTGFEGQGNRSNSDVSNEATRIKPSVSPLKIRIPGRLLQKQSSTSSASAADSAQQPTPSDLSHVRPRRSLRSQTSMNTVRSERSASSDRGQDVV